MTERTLSVSATVLAALLARGGKMAESVRAGWSRTTLHRWSTGRQVPDVANAARLATMTRGRVGVLGWTKLAATPAPEVQP